MTKRTLQRFGLVGLLGLTSLLALMWLSMPSHRIDRASFDKIAEGMSRQEVETILRCSPGKYCSASAKVDSNLPDGSRCGIAVDEVYDEQVFDINVIDGRHQSLWISDHGVILLLFDNEGRVAQKHFERMWEEPFRVKVQKWLASIL